MRDPASVLTAQEIEIAEILGVGAERFAQAVIERQERIERERADISAPNEPLTKAELRIAELMGMTPEEYAAGKRWG